MNDMNTSLPTPSVPGHRRRGLLITLIVAAVVVVSYTTLVIGINAFSWSGPFVRRMVTYVPVPVASIGWQPVWADSVFTQASALETYDRYQAGSNVPNSPSGNTIASAFTKALKDRVDEILLVQNDLTISQADIDQAYDTEVKQTGAATTIDKTLDELYGWKPTQFKLFVIRIDLARDRLREKFSFDTELSKSAKEQADTVRQEITADGKNMAEIAGRYSQDAYAANGGETDFIKRGELVEQLDQAAFSLEINAVSDVIHTKYGFHIIQILERKGEGDTAEVKLRSVFLSAPPVENAEKKYLAEHSPRILIRTLRWDATTATVTER